MKTSFDFNTVTRQELVAAVDTAIIASTPPPDAEARLRDFAKHTRFVGNNFEEGCPLDATGLYRREQHATNLPAWMEAFYRAFDRAMRMNIAEVKRVID